MHVKFFASIKETSDPLLALRLVTIMILDLTKVDLGISAYR